MDKPDKSQEKTPPRVSKEESLRDRAKQAEKADRREQAARSSGEPYRQGAGEGAQPPANRARETQLRANREAGDRDRDRNRDRDRDWIAEVSHELRLPIANIKLLVETLLDGAVEDPETARRMLQRANAEVERLQHLVVNLLSVEQVAQSRRDLSRQQVLLATRVGYAVETVSKLAAEKEIGIAIEVQDGFTIWANPEQLDQVLLNLIENAVKFTPRGGKVTVRGGPRPGTIQVSDTGIGIAAREIPRIFERFYRVDRARSRGSTGLGLSIVKHIVDLHGAKIHVASEEGSGSTFQLTFPENRVEPRPTSTPEPLEFDSNNSSST